MSSHKSHCCSRCGCEYDDPLCPVVSKRESQERPCGMMYSCTDGGRREWDNPAVCLWEILVPTVRRENGKPIRTRFHRVWDQKVRSIAGGLTILQPIKGQWIARDSMLLYSERMIPVRIACTEEQIEKIANFTAVYYDQLAVMYYKISSDVVILDCRKKRGHERKRRE